MVIESRVVGGEFVRNRLGIDRIITRSMCHRMSPVNGILAKIHEHECFRSADPRGSDLAHSLKDDITIGKGPAAGIAAIIVGKSAHIKIMAAMPAAGPLPMVMS